MPEALHIELRLFIGASIRGPRTTRPFGETEIDQGNECHLGTQLHDLDGDGDLDIVGHAWDAYRFPRLWRNDAAKAEQPGREGGRAMTRQFVDYMVQVYHYVKLSCPLMERARDRLVASRPEIAAYLDEHIDEEQGHERWVLEDLERLGLERKRVIHSRPRRETIALVGSQLYALDWLNPVGFLGYVYALEANGATVAGIEGISERLGIPTSALFAFREHARIDQGHHIPALGQALDRLITSEDEQWEIRRNLRDTTQNLSDLVIAIALA